MGIKRGLRRGLAESIKIKIGRKGKLIKSKNGKEFQMPEKLDYFLLCKTHRGEDGNFVIDEELHSPECYGPKPKVLECTLLFDDVDKIFVTEYALFKGRTKCCYGDGVTATRLSKDGSVSEVECDPDNCPYMQRKECKPSGRLHVMLTKAPRLGSVAVFRTHGWNSVSNILSSLYRIADETGGILRGIPMRLELLCKATAEHGNVHTVNIETVAADWGTVGEHVHKEIEMRRKMKLNIRQIEERAERDGLLADRDDPAEVEAEFYATPQKDLAEVDNETKADVILQDVQVESPTTDIQQQEMRADVARKDLEKTKALLEASMMKKEEASGPMEAEKDLTQAEKDAENLAASEDIATSRENDASQILDEDSF